jgi:hypothetical protein
MNLVATVQGGSPWRVPASKQWGSALASLP